MTDLSIRAVWLALDLYWTAVHAQTDCEVREFNRTGNPNAASDCPHDEASAAAGLALVAAVGACHDRGLMFLASMCDDGEDHLRLAQSLEGLRHRLEGTSDR